MSQNVLVIYLQYYKFETIFLEIKLEGVAHLEHPERHNCQGLKDQSMTSMKQKLRGDLECVS